MPDADNLNPARKAAKAVFLSDKRFKDKRENLINEIKGWLEMLDEGHESATEFVDSCKAKEAKYTKVLSQGITDALFATANLERSYRALDSFFKTANTDKVKNLRVINVYKDDIADSDSGFAQEVDTLLRNGFDRLSLKDCYSLMVVPGNVFQDKPTLLQWAKIAFKYKVMLITDHADEYSFDDLFANTEGYRDSDIELQNVIMTANWLVGRDSEKLSEDEKDSPAFYIPGSAALAGKLYDESANHGSGCGRKEIRNVRRREGGETGSAEIANRCVDGQSGDSDGLFRRTGYGLQQHDPLQRRQYGDEGVSDRPGVRLGQEGADELCA